ncbi:MAG: hypothetical protein AAFO62_07910, partial [Pseudomonadota bacterium]
MARPDKTKTTETDGSQDLGSTGAPDRRRILKGLTGTAALIGGATSAAAQGNRWWQSILGQDP